MDIHIELATSSSPLHSNSQAVLNSGSASVVHKELGFPYVIAKGQPHPLSDCAGNPLIDELGGFPSDDGLRKALTRFERFTDAQRQLDVGARTVLLRRLSRFFVGLPRVSQLAQSIYATIIEGYTGREPNTPEANRRMQDLYQAGTLKRFAEDGGGRKTAALTSALMGTPGVGKSAALKRIEELFPPVIYHPEHNLWQIPIILIEMPYLGASLNTLAEAIIRDIDRKYPAGNYIELYLRKPPNAERLLMQAFALLQIHAVGIVICDEAQNRNYKQESPSEPNRIRSKVNTSNQSPLSTLLITATNRMNVPLLFAGTSELRETLGKRMSLLRRTVGGGFSPWAPLSTTTPEGKRSEFDFFLELLWTQQLVRHVSPLTQQLKQQIHFYTFGIPDLIVKLFHEVQLRAIRSGAETVSSELVEDVALNEMLELTKLAADLRTRDADSAGRLSRITDLAIEFEVDPYEYSALKAAPAKERVQHQHSKYKKTLEPKTPLASKSAPPSSTAAPAAEPLPAAGIVAQRPAPKPTKPKKVTPKKKTPAAAKPPIALPTPTRATDLG